MRCKLFRNLDNKKCEYALAGLSAVYLANYYRPILGQKNVSDAIAYEIDDQETIIGIHLPKGEDFYRIGFEDGTGSWTDDLAQGGNGGKYRTHTLNLVNAQYDEEMLTQVKALSLGKFIAIVVDKTGKQVILGRTSGLTATSWNYASGAADADATGWTGVLSGTSSESAPLYQEIYVPTIQEAWIDSGYFRWIDNTKSSLRITALGQQQEYLPDVKDGEQLTSAKEMFADGKLKAVPRFNTSNITNFIETFKRCVFLTDVPMMDTSKSTNFFVMFEGCTSLTEIPDIDTSQGTNFNYMFNGCSSLQKKPNLDLSKAVSKVDMYQGTKFG